MGKIRTRKILFVVAAMLLCVLVAVLIRLFFFQPYRTDDPDTHRGGSRGSRSLCGQHPQREFLAVGVRQRGCLA